MREYEYDHNYVDKHSVDVAVLLLRMLCGYFLAPEKGGFRGECSTHIASMHSNTDRQQIHCCAAEAGDARHRES